jgi:hypothetical protein
LALLAPANRPRADEVPAKYRPAVNKGLAWLVKQQKRDGRWEGPGGKYNPAMTSLAGLALLSQGSTLREGKYRDNLRKATDWLLAQSRPDGLLADPDKGMYIHSHGYAMLFLACAAGDLEEGPQRRKVLRALERAARYARQAQTTRGGWGYVAAKDGGDFDEGSTTLAVVHGLRAARAAGARLPRDVLEDGQKYLEKSTTVGGGLLYSLTTKSGPQTPLTAGALAAAFAPGDYDAPVPKKWLTYCRRSVGVGIRAGYDGYTHFYYAQVVYGLGDDGWAQLFPRDRPADRLTWKAYRQEVFEGLRRAQAVDGSWAEVATGPVYATALRLCILQLDNAAVPMFARRPPRKGVAP